MPPRSSAHTSARFANHARWQCSEYVPIALANWCSGRDERRSESAATLLVCAAYARFEAALFDLGKFTEIGIGLTPVLARFSKAVARGGLIALVLGDKRERELRATVELIVVEHLVGGEFSEVPIASFAADARNQFQ